MIMRRDKEERWKERVKRKDEEKGLWGRMRRKEEEWRGKRKYEVERGRMKRKEEGWRGKRKEGRKDDEERGRMKRKEEIWSGMRNEEYEDEILSPLLSFHEPWSAEGIRPAQNLKESGLKVQLLIWAKSVNYSWQNNSLVSYWNRLLPLTLKIKNNLSLYGYTPPP